MAIENPKALFVMLLSHLRLGEENTTEIFKELSHAAQDPDIKEALESRIFLKNQIVSSLDRCFSLIGEKPVKVVDRIREVFIEDFRHELAEISSPGVRRLFVLAKAKYLVQLRVAEYRALTAMADVTRHFGVGVLLEACLAEQLAFDDRTRRLLQYIVRREFGERLAA
jgi:ferritin-like metal-binding protein YciE